VSSRLGLPQVVKRRIVVEQATEEDLVETAMYILQDQPAAGMRFIPAARASFERLAEHPDIGRTYETTHPRLQGIRIWHMRGFEKHLIFYRADEQTVFVECVLYGGRDIERLLDGDNE
jgi:toxin ParE1/3/4